jgi:SM-20-related protein
MPKGDFFRRFGLFVIEEFFDLDLCRDIRAKVDQAAHAAATVGSGKPEFEVDKKVRSVSWASMDAPVVELVKSRLTDLTPDLDRHFSVTLASCQPPQFLHYREGDFYQAHRDSTPHAEGAPVSKARRISAVIFLNAGADEPEPGTYGGGALTFFGLFDDPVGQAVGFPLDASEGMLVAFKSETIHSVAPVTHGDRYTIASWYV